MVCGCGAPCKSHMPCAKPHFRIAVRRSSRGCQLVRASLPTMTPRPFARLLRAKGKSLERERPGRLLELIVRRTNTIAVQHEATRTRKLRCDLPCVSCAARDSLTPTELNAPAYARRDSQDSECSLRLLRRAPLRRSSPTHHASRRQRERGSMDREREREMEGGSERERESMNKSNSEGRREVHKDRASKSAQGPSIEECARARERTNEKGAS
eukprot:6201893-Pleurochrysis_carterae.AAC.1